MTLCAANSASWRTFWLVFGVTGTLYAALVWPYAITHRWWATALRLVAASVILGATLGLAALRVRRTLWRMLLMAFVAPILCVALYLGLEQAPRGTWLQLPAPPVPAVLIARNTFAPDHGGEAVVQDATGASWVYLKSYSGAAWQPYNASARLSNQTPQLFQSCSAADPRVRAPRAPGRVRDALAAQSPGAGYILDQCAVLLNDGSIWVWRLYRTGLEQALATVLTATVGLVLAIVAPLTLGLADRLAARRAARMRCQGTPNQEPDAEEA